MRLKFGFNRRLVLGAMVSAALVLGAVGCSSDANLTDAEHVERAKEYKDKGEFQASVIQLKNALQKNPNNVEARWLLGQTYLDAGDGVQAFKELERAGGLGIDKNALVAPLLRARLLNGETAKVIEETSDLNAYSAEVRADLLAIRGDAYLASRQPDQARAAYDETLVLKPSSVLAQLGLARMAAQARNLAEAHQRLNQVLQGAPKFVDGWAFSGDLLRAEGKLKEAHEAYTKAIGYSYGRPDIIYNRALVRIDLGQADEAKKDFDRLAKINPGHPGILYGKGMLQFRANHLAEAQTAFEGVLVKDPDYVPAVYHLALTHMRRNQLQQAEQYLNQLLLRLPGSVDGQKMMATLKVRRGDFVAAEQILRPLMARYPNDVELLNFMSEVVLARGNVGEALGLIQKSLQLQPTAVATREKLGVGLLMKGDTSQGLQEMIHAAEAEPGFGGPDRTLVLSYMWLHQYDQAIAAAQKYGTDSKDPLPYNLIGMAYLFGKHDQAKAAAAFGEALKRAPGDSTASINLAELAIQKQDFSGATKYYSALLKQQPDNLEAMLRLGDLNLRQGKSAEASDLYTKAMNRYPDRVEPRLSVAKLSLQTGKVQEARRTLEEVQSQAQNDADFLALYGEVVLANRDINAAVTVYQRLIKVQPNAANAHFLLSQAYTAAGEGAKVRKELETAVQLAPKFVEARSALARLNVLQGSPGMQQQVDKFVADFPDHPEAFMLRGKLAERRNDMQQAMVVYSEAMKRKPRSDFAISLATAQWRSGQKDAAVVTLKSWFDAHPDDAEAGYALANFYGGQNRQDLVQATLGKVLERQPENVVVLNDLAMMLLKTNSTKALEYAQKAARLSKNPSVQDTLGVVLLERGDTARALQVFEQVRVGVSIPVVDYHYALGLSKTGRKTEARDLLRQLLKNPQTFPERAQAEALLKSLG